MATYGKGLICLTAHNTSACATAFTVSIDATGLSPRPIGKSTLLTRWGVADCIP